jgi:hypothetical protein
MLFRKAAARYWVPTAPISLSARESVVSVYVKSEDVKER